MDEVATAWHAATPLEMGDATAFLRNRALEGLFSACSDSVVSESTSFEERLPAWCGRLFLPPMRRLGTIRGGKLVTWGNYG
jgi:hypothetical protein